MSDMKKPPPLPKQVPVLVVDCAIDRETGQHAYTLHVGCERAKEVAQALQQQKSVPPPNLDVTTGRVPCKRTSSGPAMVNSQQYRDHYDGIFGRVPTGEA